MRRRLIILNARLRLVHWRWGTARHDARRRVSMRSLSDNLGPRIRLYTTNLLPKRSDLILQVLDVRPGKLQTLIQQRRLDFTLVEIHVLNAKGKFALLH